MQPPCDVAKYSVDTAWVEWLWWSQVKGTRKQTPWGGLCSQALRSAWRPKGRAQHVLNMIGEEEARWLGHAKSPTKRSRKVNAIVMLRYFPGVELIDIGGAVFDETIQERWKIHISCKSFESTCSGGGSSVGNGKVVTFEQSMVAEGKVVCSCWVRTNTILAATSLEKWRRLDERGDTKLQATFAGGTNASCPVQP